MPEGKVKKRSKTSSAPSSSEPSVVQHRTRKPQAKFGAGVSVPNEAGAGDDDDNLDDDRLSVSTAEDDVPTVILIPMAKPKVRRKSPNLPALQRAKRAAEVQARLEKAQKDIDSYNRGHFTDVKDQPLKVQIVLMETDVSVKSSILKRYEENERNRSSFDQIKFMNWVRDVLSIPFGRTLNLPVTTKDGPIEVRAYLAKVKGKLETAVAGQKAAKDEIVDFIARLVSNPRGRGNVIALAGPKGVGKTRLIRRGVADALERPFHVINLGGMNDAHVLTGHDLTYTGAKYGRLAHILIQSRCENPVIYLDEIDKIQGGSDRGMEVFRVLTHILDEEQNHEFFDEYFSGVKLNLSKVLFVASLNNVEEVDPILLDRLKIVRVDSLDDKTKVDIVRNYMLPELCREVALSHDLIDMPDEVIQYIIRVKTKAEDGCRQLKRKIETIIQKLNTQRVTGTGMFHNDIAVDYYLPSEVRRVVLTQSVVDELLRYTDMDQTHTYQHMYN